MGVETVSCPTCGAEVHIGIPMASEIVGVKAGGEEADTETTKRRTLVCPADHELTVEFTIG